MGHCASKEMDERSVHAQSSLDSFFKGYMTGKELDRIVFHQLASYGFTDKNTLFCDCSCPDEINHDDPLEDISVVFHNRWGEVFKLGGLAGLPF